MARGARRVRGRGAELLSPALPGDALLRGPLAVQHAMTLRAGGVSDGPFASLNLGSGVGDDPASVQTNRDLVAGHFGLPLDRVMRLDQVHGAEVRVAGVDPIGAQGDAVISTDPDWLLAVSAADCLPVLMHDARTGAVAAVHAGWRGAVAGVAVAAVAALAEHAGSRSSDLTVWFGAAIRAERYQVGGEVAEAFARAGAPESAVRPDPGREGRFRADVPALVRAQLVRAGVRPDSIHDSGVCTSADPRCYSHRRDDGVTGRHWAVIRAVSPGAPSN